MRMSRGKTDIMKTGIQRESILKDNIDTIKNDVVIPVNSKEKITELSEYMVFL